MNDDKSDQSKLTIEAITDPSEVDCDCRVGVIERTAPDDLDGECARCGRAIFYRPHPPYLCTFICVICAGPILDAVIGFANKPPFKDMKELCEWVHKQNNQTNHMKVIHWPDLAKSIGEKPARAEIIRQLRMMADSLESNQYPDVMDCKIVPGAQLDNQTILRLEITLSHLWPG